MSNSGSPKVGYRCGVLIDGTGSPARRDVLLIVDAGRVDAVMAADGPVTPDIPLHDLSGCTVTPGIIDAHAHLCHTFSGVQSGHNTADPIDVICWGMASCTAALRSGITTVVDAGSPDGLALRLAALVDAGLTPGPHVIAAGPAITTTAGHGAEIGVAADTADEVVRAVRDCVARGAGIIKMMVTGGSIDRRPTNRRRAQYTEEQLAAGIEDAHRLGRRVVGHANATEGIGRAVRAGIDIVAHCNWLGSSPRSVEVDEEIVRLMKERDVSIDLNIGGALRDLDSTDGHVLNWPYDAPLPSTRWELLAPIRSQGVRLYLTSDAAGPAIGKFTDFLRNLRNRWDISAEELISLVTARPAEALGLAGQRGTLVEGSAADFVAFEGDLCVEPDALVKPSLVVREGVDAVVHGNLAPADAALSGERVAEAEHALEHHLFATNLK